MSGSGWTRRQLLQRGGVSAAGLSGLSAAGFAGYAWPHAAPPHEQSASAGSSPDVLRFVSRPDLQPPEVDLSHHGSAAGAGSRARQPARGEPRYVFLASRGYIGPGVGQPGLMIVDRTGRLVWFDRTPGLQPMNFGVQSYRGRPVLAWWAGRIKAGIGEGTGYLADTSYQIIATVQAGNGLKADLHEFNLTPQGTALITAFRTRRASLSALGGPAKGTIYSSVAQEIDIATGSVLFEWDSTDHVAVTETYKPLSSTAAGKPFDYFHINSIDLAPDGDLLISGRDTWAVYKVSRSTGAIRWRLGGRKSDFALGPGARFYWQHHVRAHGPSTLSIFDDGASPPEEKQSRAILVHLDTRAMRATLRRAYTHPARLVAANQGSMQVLPGGSVFVGWGSQPYFSEFAGDGELLLDGQLPMGDQSYRAFTFDWTGHPAAQPDVAVRPNPAWGTAVYASWNGATEVAQWTVLAGRGPSDLAEVASQRKGGFETVIAVNSVGPYFAVAARDGNGRILGNSAATRLTTG